MSPVMKKNTLEGFKEISPQATIDVRNSTRGGKGIKI